MFSIGSYQVINEIYRSPNSVVYRGKHAESGMPVALKQLNKDYPNPEQIGRFRREFDMTRAIASDGVIQALEFFRYENTNVIVLEDIGGTSLNQALSSRPLSINEFLPLAIKMVESLASVHQKRFIHKDINPSNWVWNQSTQQLKLIDFGIASELPIERAQCIHPLKLEGTLAYISPEQTGRMNRSMDFRTDFYSLGMTFYEMLAGTLPFESQDPMAWIHWHIAQRPQPLDRVNPAIPAQLSDIILKLIAKTAEERYAGLSGLKHDLIQCWQYWSESSRILPFTIATRDVPERLNVSQKLYGREAEIQQLQKAFDLTLAGERSFFCVKGRSGVGKSCLIHELTKSIVARGYFIEGKFDQFERNTPYNSLIQAFQSLVRQILAESDAQINRWRTRLLDALDGNSSIIVDVIPELALIIGEQSSASLTASDIKNRFNITFQRFVQVFCAADHPLVIFLDDMQWADLSSLQLLEQLLINDNTKQLMIVIAYRDDEVSAVHPLAQLLNDLSRQSVVIATLQLKSLLLHDVQQLLADTFYRKPEACLPLAQLCLEKTLGNPFFLNQFLHSLEEKLLVRFDTALNQWTWNIEQLKHTAMTDNVVDLVVQKLQQFSPKTHRLLSMAACIGNQFDLLTLTNVSREPIETIARRLWDVVIAGFIIPLNFSYRWADTLSMNPRQTSGSTQNSDKSSDEGSDKIVPTYRFLHDRVQQAAYSLIPESEKAHIHLTVAEALMESNSEHQINDLIFEIANHFNFARQLLNADSDRLRFAEFHLKAAKRAKSSAAYAPSLKYLKDGLSMLNEENWQQHYSLMLEMYTEATEVAYLNGDYETMQSFAGTTLAHTETLLDIIGIRETQILAFTAQHRTAEAVELGLETLALLNIEMPAFPDQEQVQAALMETMQQLTATTSEQLLNLPRMTDPQQLAIQRILNWMLSPAYKYSPLLFPLSVFKLLQLSSRYGNSHVSAFAYTSLGTVLCGIANELSAGYEFGELGLKLANKLGVEEQKAKSAYAFNVFIRHWREPLENTLKALKQNFQVGLAAGDFEYAAWSGMMINVHAFFTGQTLPELSQSTQEYYRAIAQIKQETPLLHMSIFFQSISNLRGLSKQATCLVGTYYDENISQPLHLEAHDQTALFILHFNRMILCYLLEEYEVALMEAELGETYLGGVVSSPYIPQFYFFDALIRLALCEKWIKESIKVSAHLEKAIANREKFTIWAEYSPDNYHNKTVLLDAEIGRVKGEPTLKTIEKYQEAIVNARNENVIQEEALANERLASFWLQTGQNEIAALYLTKALHLYQLWGAEAKVHQLQQHYGHLLSSNQPAPDQQQMATFGTRTWSFTQDTTSGFLDLLSVIKASQAISGEISMEKLPQTMIGLVLENAGAQTGYLLLAQESPSSLEQTWTIEAESSVANELVNELSSAPLNMDSDPRFPVSLLKFVLRSKESVVLKDASESKEFGKDCYISAHKPKSILCAPIVRNGKVTGLVYLENNSTAGAFTQDHLNTVMLLASQTAISLENAALYANLEARVAIRTQELNEANTKLTLLATTDALSGAFNRRHFLEMATEEIQRAKRYSRPLIVMMIDIDFFKKVNDTYGHAAGDSAIKQVASICQNSLREQDLFGRLGGEEFAVLLPETKIEDGMLLAQRIRSTVESRVIEQDPHRFSVTLSIGVSGLSESNSTIDLLLQLADEALYTAKKTGRNRVELALH